MHSDAGRGGEREEGWGSVSGRREDGYCTAVHTPRPPAPPCLHATSYLLLVHNTMWIKLQEMIFIFTCRYLFVQYFKLILNVATMHNALDVPPHLQEA